MYFKQADPACFYLEYNYMNFWWILKLGPALKKLCKSQVSLQV